MEVFLSFKSHEGRKKVTESFFSGHTSLSFNMIIVTMIKNIRELFNIFDMMHKFPGTIFSLSVPTKFLWL